MIGLGHLFQIYSGQVNSILYHIAIFGVIQSSYFKRVWSFLAVATNSILIFKIYIERYGAIQILIGHFLCDTLNIVCLLICSISSCSSSPYLLVVDIFPMSMISLRSL